jgi:hypothetical protein
MAAVENEIRVAKEIHDDRRCRDRQQKSRLARAVIVSVPSVERRREETPFGPLKSLLAHPIVPDLGAAASFENIEKLVIHMSFGLQRAAGRNLDDVHARNTAATL